jgi:hypothetical protein
MARLAASPRAASYRQIADFVKIITAKQYFPISLLTTSKIAPSPISYDFPIAKHF